MQLLVTLASLLGIEVDELLDRLKRNTLGWSVVALFAAITLVFLLVALNAWLSIYLGPALAPLAVAGGALVIALAAWLAIALAEAHDKRVATEKARSAEKTALVTTAALTALPLLLKSDLMRKLGIPVGGALAAAYLLAKPGSHDEHDAGD